MLFLIVHQTTMNNHFFAGIKTLWLPAAAAAAKLARRQCIQFFFVIYSKTQFFVYIQTIK